MSKHIRPDPNSQPPSGSANTANITTWNQPKPLRAFDPPRFPTEALPAWLREFVEGEAIATQTPTDLAGTLVLSAIAAAAARRVVVEPKPGWREPVNLYTVCVLPSGSRKSAVFRDVVSPVEKVEQKAVEVARGRIAVAMEEAEQLKREVARLKKKTADGDADDDEMNAATRRLNEHTIPSYPRLIADDVTAEQLEVLLERHGGRMGVFSAEGNVFDLMAGRYSKSGVMNIGVFLQAHAGDTIRVDRVTREPVMIQNPALTLGLAVQPSVVDGLADRKEFRGRGLTARFLYALPESNVGRREINPPPLSEHVRSVYERNLSKLFETDEPADDFGDQTDGPHIEEIRVLRFDDEATGLFDRFRADVESALNAGGDLSDIVEWGSKLPGAVARIAALLRIAERPGDPVSKIAIIPMDIVERAIKLGRYFVPHARAAFALMGADPAMADAMFVMDRIVANEVMSISKRDLFEQTKGRFKKVKNLDPALVILQEHEYLRRQEQSSRSGPGRRPSPVFDVNPFTWSQYSQKSQNP